MLLVEHQWKISKQHSNQIEAIVSETSLRIIHSFFVFVPQLLEVKQSQPKKGEELDSYRGEKAREMAESVLLADGSNQHSASVQLVSAREDHSSTAA